MKGKHFDETGVQGGGGGGGCAITFYFGETEKGLLRGSVANHAFQILTLRSGKLEMFLAGRRIRYLGSCKVVIAQHRSIFEGWGK